MPGLQWSRRAPFWLFPTRRARFILDRLRSGSRTYDAGLIDKEYGELFRTDAACTADSVILWGWFLHKGVSCKTAPWFQLTLRSDQAPWLFKDGLGSSWASTTAELLASLVALHILERDFSQILSDRAISDAVFQGAQTTRRQARFLPGCSRRRSH